jgi:hypothetical protein
VADRGLGSSARLARRGQAGGPAGRRGRARPGVDCTPGRAVGTPSVRRTPAVTGGPRARWLTGLGVQDRWVAWLTPTARPAWLTRAARAALPAAPARREVRDDVGTPAFRTRRRTRVPTRLDADLCRVADLAALVPPAPAGRTRTGAAQPAPAAGGPARPNGGRRVAGTDRVCPRGEPGPPGEVPLSHPATPQRGAHRLSGGAAVARRAADGEAPRGVARAPRPPPSGGAARQAAAAQALPGADHPPATTTSAVGPASARRRTSCHSAKSPV